MATFGTGDLKAIFLIFIGLIIAATIMVPIANQTNLETNTFSVTNVSATVPSANGVTDLTGRQLVGTGTATVNGVESENLTIRTAISPITGLLSVQLFANDTTDPSIVNVTYDYQPDGYVSDVGGRAVTNLILLFAALASLVYVITILYQEGSFGKLIRGNF